MDEHVHDRIDEEVTTVAGSGATAPGTTDAVVSDGSADAAAQTLHALAAIAKTVQRATSIEEVALAAAPEARLALDAASVSFCVWEREQGHVRVLVNDGDLGPDEVALPTDETYQLADYDPVAPLLESGLGYVAQLDASDDVSRSLSSTLQELDKASCLGVPILLDNRVWGELFATRRADQSRFTLEDVDVATTLAAQVAAGVAQVEHVERMSRLAYADPLTGLANRRAIDERLDVALAQHRADGTVVSLVVCDVNGLKRINDELGHEAGDHLLQHFADLLATSAGMVRGSLSGRIGGDEFCILLQGCSADDAVAVAEDVCRRAAEAIEEGVACGVASTGDAVGQVDTPARLLRLADAAQTRAKRSRSRWPVVAGRGLPEDATVRLADVPGLEGGDRRSLRSRATPVSTRLLDIVLDSLDHSGATGVQDRLEVVADAMARSLDAAGWWVSRVENGSRTIHTVGCSVYRKAADVADEAQAVFASAQTTYELDSYPLTEAALDGDGFVVEVGDPTADRAEVSLLEAAGFRGLLAAGCRDAAGNGWLVELHADEISASISELAPTLRAVVAVAAAGR